MKNNDPKYWDALLRNYLSGNISEEDRFALEKRALDDPFLMDAIEGYQLSSSEESLDGIGRLDQMIDRFQNKKRRKYLWWTSAAASIVLIIGTLSLWHTQTTELHQEIETNQTHIEADTPVKIDQIAQNTEEKNPNVMDDALALSEETNPKIKSPKVGLPKSKSKAQTNTENLVRETNNTSEKMTDAIVTNSSETEVLIVENKHNEGRKNRQESNFASAPEEELLVDADTQHQNIEQQEMVAEIDSILIAGQVVDEQMFPLIGATVWEKNTENRATADLDGKFELNLENENSNIIISYIGYESIELAAASVDSFLTITMSESTLLMDEVVVTRSKSESDTQDRNIAMIRSDSLIVLQGEATLLPPREWSEVKHQIEKIFNEESVNFGQDSTSIVVEFEIDKKGKSSNFKIIESISKNLDQKIIKIIDSSGPWQMSSTTDTLSKVRYSIIFEYRK